MVYSADKQLIQLNEHSSMNSSNYVIINSGTMVVRVKGSNLANFLENHSSFKKSNIFSDTSGIISNAIKGGYSLEKVVFVKKISDTANVACGITVAGTQIFPAREISNTITVIAIEEMFDLSAAKSLYIHGTWHGSVSMSVYGIMKRIIY